MPTDRCKVEFYKEPSSKGLTIIHQKEKIMKNPQTLLASAMLAVAGVVCAFVLRSGIVAFKDMDRTVEVKGLAEREVKADKVTWSLKYKELGNDPSVMYDILTKKNSIVKAFLTQAGIQEADISINPPTIVDRQADNYNNDIMTYRYKATSVITVTSSDVDKVRGLMRRQSELMKQGVAIVGEEYGEGNGAVYEFTGLTQIKPEMVEEATRNARTTAQKFADDSGSRIGKIRRAQQGQFSIENRDGNTPYIKRVRVVSTVEYSLE